MEPKEMMEYYWSIIPTEKSEAKTYQELQMILGVGDRRIRTILHDLSVYDNGDSYVLIRSGKGKGFYKTDDKREIEIYKKEIQHKALSLLACTTKAIRILRSNIDQVAFDNNMAAARCKAGLSLRQVCSRTKDLRIDKSLLSKMENGIVLPTRAIVLRLSEIYKMPAEKIFKEIK